MEDLAQESVGRLGSAKTQWGFPYLYNFTRFFFHCASKIELLDMAILRNDMDSRTYFGGKQIVGELINLTFLSVLIALM